MPSGTIFLEPGRKSDLKTFVHLCGLFWLCILSVPGLPARTGAATPEVTIGSKNFTESVILADMAAQLVQSAGARARLRLELGGTRVLWDSLVQGAIDIYPEYTGTLTEEIFAGQGINGLQALQQALATHGIRMTASLGFNNNYAIGMKKEVCRKRGLAKISDLRRYPGLRLGFSNEFMDRQDGWPGLQARYGLPQHHVFGMDHDLALRGIESSAIDATEVYTTDPEIAYYGLCILQDDLAYFPEYTAVLLYRADLEKRAPGVVAALARLEGRITPTDMPDMNKQVKIGKMPESQVAANFLARHLALQNHGAPGKPGGQNLAAYQGTSLVSVDFITDGHLDGHPPGDYGRPKTGLEQDHFGYNRDHSDHSLPGPAGVHDPLAGYWRPAGYFSPFSL